MSRIPNDTGVTLEQDPLIRQLTERVRDVLSSRQSDRLDDDPVLTRMIERARLALSPGVMRRRVHESRSSEQLVSENLVLCGSKCVPVTERLVVRPRAARPEVSAEATNGGATRHRAKVAHVDKKNQNNRIYPARVMKAQLERFAPLLKSGYLTGAIDHIGGLAGGNLADTCIIWRDLSIEPDGSVIGEFELVELHSKGIDLKAQVDAGVALGFSTYGFGTAHEPSEAERERYGLSESEPAVVMNDDYELKKIDAVDDPAVADARLISSTK